jgi:uncharacterized protein
MTLIIDAGPMIALGDRRDPVWGPIDNLLRTYPGQLVIPAPVTAEVDYLLQGRFGAGANRPFLADLAARKFQVVCLEPQEYERIVFLNRRYAALNPGLADLSVVVLANRFRTNKIVTFDERHFRAMQPLQGGSFTILPADSEPE